MAADKTTKPTHRGNCYVLVFGLPRPDETFVLAPGLSLIPLEAPLDVFDLAALGSVGFREWAALEPFARGCTCEIESAADSAIEPGLDALNRAWLAISLLVLRGFPHAKGIAVSGYRWGHVPIKGRSASWNHPVEPSHRRARTDLPPFSGGLLDLHFKAIVEATSEPEITDDHAKWLQASYHAAHHLATSSASFFLALEAAVDWRYSPDARSAIARIWSGIEAMLGITSELVFRISLLSACLLEPRGQSRQQRFRDVKKLYGLRSKAVHGDTLSEDKLSEALRESFALLRDLLLSSVSRGHVLTQGDFDEALFF